MSPEMIKAPDTPPDSNDFRGSLAIFHHPVFQLGKGEMDRLLRDMGEIEYRKRHTERVFYGEALYHAVQITLLDFFNTSSKSKEDADIPIQYIDLIVRFMGMLQRGKYIEHRKLDYYADQLGISAKYLSNVMRTYTGCGASYWLNRFTMVHLCKLVRDTSMTFSAIADQFGFSSPSHFYMYFQGQLGMSPSEFRWG